MMISWLIFGGEKGLRRGLGGLVLGEWCRVVYHIIVYNSIVYSFHSSIGNMKIQDGRTTSLSTLTPLPLPLKMKTPIPIPLSKMTNKLPPKSQHHLPISNKEKKKEYLVTSPPKEKNASKFTSHNHNLHITTTTTTHNLPIPP